MRVSGIFILLIATAVCSVSAAEPVTPVADANPPAYIIEGKPVSAQDYSKIMAIAVEVDAALAANQPVPKETYGQLIQLINALDSQSVPIALFFFNKWSKNEELNTFLAEQVSKSYSYSTANIPELIQASFDETRQFEQVGMSDYGLVFRDDLLPMRVAITLHEFALFLTISKSSGFPEDILQPVLLKALKSGSFSETENKNIAKSLDLLANIVKNLHRIPYVKPDLSKLPWGIPVSGAQIAANLSMVTHRSAVATTIPIRVLVRNLGNSTVTTVEGGPNYGIGFSALDKQGRRIDSSESSIKPKIRADKIEIDSGGTVSILGQLPSELLASSDGKIIATIQLNDGRGNFEALSQAIDVSAIYLAMGVSKPVSGASSTKSAVP